MRGLFKRKGSDVWQGRFRIPEDLWNRREELRSLGVSVGGSQGFAKSLGSHDHAAAEEVYRSRLSEWSRTMRVWRLIADSGPKSLSHKQVIALAGEVGRAILLAYEEEPALAPRPPRDWLAFLGAAVRSLAASPTVYMGDPVDDFIAELSTVPSPTLLQYIDTELPRAAPWRVAWLEAARIVVKAYLESVGGSEVDRVLEAHGLAVDSETRTRLWHSAAKFVEHAYESLGDRLEGDYSVPDWSEALPSFEKPRGGSDAPEGPHGQRITFDSIIDKRQTKAQAGLSARPLAASSVKKYRAACEDFARYRRSSDAATVTREEGEAWKAHLAASGLHQKTVRDKLAAVKAVLVWGNQQLAGELFGDRHPLKYVELPSKPERDSEAKTYSLAEARQILRSARREEDATRRWVPWLLAYSGMRVSEAAQLQKEDFKVFMGCPYFHVRVGDGRTTKTHKARRIPLHPALVSEGLLKFVEKAPSGRLFSKRTQQDLSEWIRREVFGDRGTGKPPSHGFRHLFEDLCRIYELGENAARYIAGRSSGSSAEGYGKSEAMVPALAREIAKIERLLVETDDEEAE